MKIIKNNQFKATFAQNENLTLWGGIITDLANALYVLIF